MRSPAERHDPSPAETCVESTAWQEPSDAVGSAGGCDQDLPVVLCENGHWQACDALDLDEAVLPKGGVEATVVPIAGEHQKLVVFGYARYDDFPTQQSRRSPFVTELALGRDFPVERTIGLVARERLSRDVLSVDAQAAGPGGHDLAVRLNDDPIEPIVSVERRLH